MSPGGPGAPRARRRSLRFRLVALLAGPGIFPLALAVLLLFPVFRQEILESQGAALAREASFLAAEVEVFLRASSNLSEARDVVESFRRGRRGRAYLYDDTGARLAGLPDLPAPPVGQTGPLGQGGRRDEGWSTFELGRASYLAGMARVRTERALPPAPRGAWAVAVVQPESEVLAPLYAGVETVALFFFGVAALSLLFSWRLAERFLTPLRKLRHGAEIISRTNLSHRIDVRTGDELEDLAGDFNRMAEGLQRSYGELEERVRETTLHLTRERNRLAAVLQTMVEGVVMASDDGRVVLVTPRARLALGARASSGIGAPLADLLPEDRVAFHLRRIWRAWGEGREAAEDVIFPLADGRLLRGVLSTVRGPAGELAGYLFVFRDLGAEREEAERPLEALREIPRLLKGPAATLRSLADVLEARPDMPEAKRGEFLRAVREEVSRLTDRLATAEVAAAAAESARWPSARIDARELLEEAAEGVPGVTLAVDLPPDGRAWVQVEPYSWTRCLGTVLRWLRERAPGAALEARLSVEEGAVVATFRAEGLAEADVSGLEGVAVALGGEEAVSLGEVVGRNRGELWGRRAGASFEVRLALVGGPARGAASEAPAAEGQPEFYDFDLFLRRPSVESGDLLSTPLGDLEYVVFDTETTGLRPSEGDEIVSLSAVRVRGGRIAPGDAFHSLVKPGRPIPAESTWFHGLDDAAVAGAPPLADVLPLFRAYAGGAVLVAHNAAFDKKCLDLAADGLGQPALENPVLDTLLLSYGVHGELEGHSLDAIAARLGVQIAGRHTSPGDARATAEILLGLLPLLAARGIATLADAKAFCDKMLLLRWRTSRF